LILLEGAADAAVVAEQHFRRAFDLARRQDALFWELRMATSPARLWLDRHRAAEARALLGPVYSRFTEGFGTPDLQAARACYSNNSLTRSSTSSHSWRSKVSRDRPPCISAPLGRDGVPLQPADSPKVSAQTALAVKVRFCEGFRTTAHCDSAGRHRGRRPKASREGTRGELRYEMCRAMAI
jgi:hypothetical protein